MSTHRRAIAIALLVAVGLGVWPLLSLAADPPTARLADNVPESAIMSNGTGFFVNTSGAVVTARHVVENCKKIVVMKNRNLYPVRRAVISKTMDISLLFPVIGVTEAAEIEADNTLHDGEPVYFLGDNVLRTTKSDRPALTNAFVATDQAEASTEYLFSITGFGVPGYSGGPVLNSKGHVIGIILGKQELVHRTRNFVLGVSSDVRSVTPVAIKKLLKANKVPYRLGSATAESRLPNQVIADKISVGVICVK
jgi:S1-C subfamily serine protease